jgi:hypothetical protein
MKNSCLKGHSYTVVLSGTFPLRTLSESAIEYTYFDSHFPLDGKIFVPFRFDKIFVQRRLQAAICRFCDISRRSKPLKPPCATPKVWAFGAILLLERGLFLIVLTKFSPVPGLLRFIYPAPLLVHPHSCLIHLVTASCGCRYALIASNSASGYESHNKAFRCSGNRNFSSRARSSILSKRS